MNEMANRARQQAERITREHGDKAKSMLDKLAKDQAQAMLQEMEEMQEEMMMRENRRGRVLARERWGAAKVPRSTHTCPLSSNTLNVLLIKCPLCTG